MRHRAGPFLEKFLVLWGRLNPQIQDCARCCDRGLQGALMKGISVSHVREGFLEEATLDQRLRGQDI